MEQRQSHFLCFKCSKTFLTSRNLTDHFKYNHPYLSAYVCKQENCFRSFRDIISFRKHLLSKHLIGVINTEDKSKKNMECTISENISLENELLHNTAIPQVIPHCEYIEQNTQNPLFLFVNFFSKLYSQSTINRKTVQEVVNYTKELSGGIFSYISEKLKSLNEPAEIKVFLDKTFQDILKQFNELDTEFKRFKFLEQQNVYVKPTPYTLGNEMVLVKTNTSGEPVPNIKNVVGQKICIKTVLKHFLELPGVLNEIEKFIQEEEQIDSPKIFTSCLQGELWQNTKKKMVTKEFYLYTYFSMTLNPLMFWDQELGTIK